MSILNHPDYESCIKPWCTAVAAGKEPPKVEFGDAQHVWTLVEVPVWYNERRYRLVPRKIMIGKREVNAPSVPGDYRLSLFGATNKSYFFDFRTKEDRDAAHDAIKELLESAGTTEQSTWPSKTYGPSTGPADFPEDNHLENGNYLNICYRCAVTFVGHKNRVCCKLCADKATEPTK